MEFDASGNPHNIAIDRNDNVYVADRGNRRIQVFETDGNFKYFLFLNAPYDKSRHPVHGLACPNENTVYVADMNNWRVQKIVIKGGATATRRGHMDGLPRRMVENRAKTRRTAFWSRRGGEYCQNEQPASAGIADAVGYSFGSNDQLTGLDR
jgi:hypothetical protein